MLQELAAMRIAILVEDGFEQVELTGPRAALTEAGAETLIVSPRGGTVRGWNADQPGDAFNVDLLLADAQPNDFHGLLLPGGTRNAEGLRANPDAVAFVRAIAEQGKGIAAICHGPLVLVSAGVARDRTLTSWPALEAEIRNGGGEWIDRMVVEENALVTSRQADDLPAFNIAAIAMFAASRPVSARPLETELRKE